MANEQTSTLDDNTTIQSFDAPLSPEQAEISAVNKKPNKLTKESEAVDNLLRVNVLTPNVSTFDYPHKLYAVEVAFDNRVYGGKPSGDDLISSWLQARFKKEIEAGRSNQKDLEEVLTNVQAQSEETKEQLAKAVLSRKTETEDGEDVESKMDEIEQNTATRFYVDNIGYYLEAYQVKAGLKLAASISGLTRELKGTSTRIGMKDIMQHLVHVFPIRIYLAKFDRELSEFDTSTEAMFGRKPSNPDKDLDQVDSGIWWVGSQWTPQEYVSPGHVSGPTGDRSILKKRQYISGDPATGQALRIFFGIKVAKCQNHLDDQVMALMMAYFGDNGLGADRSQGGGRFEVISGPTIVRDYDPPMPGKKAPAAGAPTQSKPAKATKAAK